MKRNGFLRHWRRERHEWLAFAGVVFPNLGLFAVFTYGPVRNTAGEACAPVAQGPYGTRLPAFEIIGGFSRTPCSGA